MKLRRIPLFLIVFAASVTATPVHAQLYKWLDELGVTHYSDRRPAEPRAAAKVEPVANRVSIYSPDKSLLQAVEASRLDGSRPAAPTEPSRGRAPHLGSTTAALPPVVYDPCQLTDCTGVSGVHYGYPSTVPAPYWRRLPQAVLPPGAIAGTINSNGTIPGNSASAGSAVPEPANPGPRMNPLAGHSVREPSRR